MKRFLLAFFLLLSPAPCFAQLEMMGVTASGGAGGGAYTGPGNVVSGAFVWWGLRAYNAAYATGLGKIANICTPSTGTNVCADVFSDASGNFNLAGSGTLTCNNSGSICTVKTLYDQSGANACSGGVPCDVTQATEANRPILVVPGVGNNCPTTAKFCISSTIGSTKILAAAVGLTSAVSQIFSMVVSYNNTGSGTEYILNANVTVPSIDPAFGGVNKIVCSAGASNGVTATDNVYHAVQCIVNNTNSTVVVDTTTNNPIAMGANGTFNAIFYLFNDGPGNTHGFGGFFLELGLWPSDLTSTVATMNTNIHTYWGF